MRISIYLLAVSVVFTHFSCNSNGDKKKEPHVLHTADTSHHAPIRERPFGTYEGKPVTEYTITNGNGMEVSVINYGGTLTRILTPDRNGAYADVITGFENLDGFLQKGNPYFGALIGRYGNRIANAKFTLEGKAYTLVANDHANSLHGGNKGYDKVYWTISKQAGDSSLKLTYTSPDGEEGYPGKLEIQVLYTLTSHNGLIIDYTATTDKATPINLTSHAYFNLSGGKAPNILDHSLFIKADQYTPVNDQLIPTGAIESVKGSPMDFATPKKIGRDITQVKGGFDHNWILNKQDNSLELIATLSDSSSGRIMDVWTTEPGIQFYSGNFMDGTLTNTKNGQTYHAHAALCLETQHYPDSPNQPAFPTTILKPGAVYRHTTMYAFSAK